MDKTKKTAEEYEYYKYKSAIKIIKFNARDKNDVLYHVLKVSGKL